MSHYWILQKKNEGEWEQVDHIPGGFGYKKILPKAVKLIKEKCLLGKFRIESYGAVENRHGNYRPITKLITKGLLA